MDNGSATGLSDSLRKFSVDDNSIDKLDNLQKRDVAMLEYAVKLTLTPGDLNATDVVRLRESGFDDGAIHDICAVTGYFAFVNRIADGLGVELESSRKP